VLRDSVVEEARLGGLDLVGEVHAAFDSFLEVVQCDKDGLGQHVDSFEFLDEAVLEWLAFLTVDRQLVDLLHDSRQVGETVQLDFLFDAVRNLQ